MKRSHEDMVKGYHSSSSASQSSLTPGVRLTKAEKVEAEVITELRDCLFVLTPRFLEELLPVDDTIIDSVYATARKGRRSLYNSSKRVWRYMPTSSQREKKMYDSFVSVAKGLTTASETAGRERGIEPAYKTQWMAIGDRSPSSRDLNASDMRPDIAATINCEQTGDTLKVPWSRINVPMEVKKENTPQNTSTIIQLAKYIRQVFRECHDRRFVLGIVLAGNRMAVYLGYRNGLLGSLVFDINEEPKLLIRVIAAIALLPAHALGWDPTMKRYRAPEPSALSYDVPLEEIPKNADQDKWEFEVSQPSKDDPTNIQSNSKHLFVTWDWLSLVPGDAIEGRATRIWKAWRAEDMNLPEGERKLYILKDTWRDERRGFEGEMYEMIGECNGVAKMCSYGAVIVDGKIDETKTIRHDLEPQGPSRQLRSQQASRQEPQTKERKSVPTYFVHGDYLPVSPGNNGKVKAKNRIHSRVVLETYGWPIDRAKSLPELVGAMRDAIAGHREVHRKGVLHRDVSLGNLLITACPSPSPGSRGTLIDFDNAIQWKTHQTVTDDPLTATFPFLSYEIYLKKRMLRAKADLDKDCVDNFRGPTPLHDLESCFWVLVWICLSRSGPCCCREELAPHFTPSKSDSKTKNFVDEWTNLFQSTEKEMAMAKAMQFKGDEILGLVNFMPAFTSPLAKLVVQFFDVLRSAYVSYDVSPEDLYRQILEIFDEAEARLASASPEGNAEWIRLRVEEEERRRQDTGRWGIHVPELKSRVAAALEEESLVESSEDDLGPSTPVKKRRTASRTVNVAV